MDKDIERFSDLTDFVADEYNKMAESFDIKQPLPRLLEFTEKNLLKYFRVYDGPLYRIQKLRAKLLYKKSKLDVDIEAAIFTMPHNWLWKLLHWRLWQKVKLRLAMQEPPSKPETATEVLYPAVVENRDITPVSDDDS